MHRYALIGAGGTGSHLLGPLFRYLRTYHGADPWTLAVLDGDNVEERNLERQLFQNHTVTMNKAEALAESIDRSIIAIPEYLSEQNITRYLRDGTTVLIAVDNFPVRSLIEHHMQTLQNGVVVNGGNEDSTGSCQVWVRKDGQNVTPPMSFMHDEIHAGGDDRAVMSCAQIAQIPGGEQLIIANMASALYMLTALHLHHQNIENHWTELQFDLITGASYGLNQRDRRGWQNWLT